MNSLDDYRIVGLGPFTTMVGLSLSAFIYCYYGSRITTKPTQLIQSIYGTPWYLLPVKRQREIYMMIIYGQIEIAYDGFGIVFCSLKTFGLVNIPRNI